MKDIINRIITYFLIFIGLLSKNLSAKHRNSFGNIIGDILRIISPKRKNITLANLELAFPYKEFNWKKRVLIDSYRNLGIVLAEVVALKYINNDEMSKYVEIDDISRIIEMYKRGKGLILLSGHYGNWEFMAYSLGALYNLPVLIVVKPQSNNHSNNLLNEYRIRSGNSVVSMYGAARDIVKTIRRGGVVALLADQSATSDKDVYVEFFGKMASTFEAPANLALKFNVPILMGFCERKKDGTYFVRTLELKHEDLKFNKEGIIELTKRHVRILEEAIILHPELWAWQHRRWKHTI